jgi:hypothetical protein
MIGVGMCMRMETRLTHELGWSDNFNQEARRIAAIMLLETDRGSDARETRLRQVMHVGLELALESCFNIGEPCLNHSASAQIVV